jgi:hypothetical protein
MRSIARAYTYIFLREVLVESWPSLSLTAWSPTLATLHRYMQIVGKVKLALTPRMNHFWNVGFTVGARGLSTGEMPSGDGFISIDLDLLDHNLVVRTSNKETRALALVPRPVAGFYEEFMAILQALGVDVKIDDRPVELLEERIPFREDRRHASYDPDPVERLLRILQKSAQAMEEFRARFRGKASPVLFYWGTFDLCAARFSGRPAPVPPDADSINREAFSHECYECGFWPGDSRFPAPAYYAFAVPAPPNLAKALPRRWNATLGEFLLPYEAVRAAADPRTTLLDFFQSTYEAAAELARWDRASLEVPSALEIPEQPTVH